MQYFDIHTAHRISAAVTALGIELPENLATALDTEKAVMAIRSPGANIDALVKAAARAVADGDEVEADRLVDEALRAPIRSKLLVQRRVDAQGAVVRAFTAARRELVTGLAELADAAIAVIEGDDVDARRAAADQLVEHYRLRDELLGLPTHPASSPLAHAVGLRRWAVLGDWWRPNGISIPAAPWNAATPAEGLLTGVASGGRLAFMTDAQEINERVEEHSATIDRALHLGKPSRGVGVAAI